MRDSKHRRRRSLLRLITRDPDICGGSPVITGTNISVADVVSWPDYGIEDPARVIHVLGSITNRQLDAAMAYWFEHFHEIEAEIARDRIKRRRN